MSKKLLTLIAVLSILSLILGACASATPAPVETTEQPAQAAEKHCVPTSQENIGTWCYDPNKPLKIVVILGTSQHSFYVSLRAGALNAAKDFNLDVDVQGATDFSPVAQTPIINAVIEAKPDALILVPTDPVALEERMRAIAKAGIVLFTADNDSQNKKLRIANVESDHDEGGYAAAQAIAKAIGKKGTVVALGTEPTNLVPNLRIDGFLRGIKEYPDIKVLETQYGSFDLTEAANVTNAILSANSDLNAIFASAEPVGKGAGNAVRNAGKKVLIGSVDASPAQQKDLADGITDFLVVQKPQTIGYEVIRIVKEYLTGVETSQSPLLPAGTKLTELPDIIHTGSLLAVRDTAICPDNVPDVPCGTADDPDIQPWLYLTIE